MKNQPILGIKLKADNFVIFDPPLYIDNIDIKSTTLVPLLNGKSRVSTSFLPNTHTVSTTFVNNSPIEVNVTFTFKPARIPKLRGIGCLDKMDVFIRLSRGFPSNYYFPEMKVISVTRNITQNMAEDIRFVLSGNKAIEGDGADKLFIAQMRKREPFVFR